MTQNQIAFYKAKEERRHNIRTEGQTDASIGENIRHNKASESINWYSAKTGAAVGFAQASAAQAQARASQAQAAAALRQAEVANKKVEYDYSLGVVRNANDLRKIVQDNQVNWAKQNENERHNRVMEGYKQDEILLGTFTDTISAGASAAGAYSKFLPIE